MPIMAMMPPIVLDPGDALVVDLVVDSIDAADLPASVVEVYADHEHGGHLVVELTPGPCGFAGVSALGGVCSYARVRTPLGWVPIDFINGGPDAPSTSPSKSDGPSAEPIPQAYSAALLAFASLPSPPWDRLASYARTIAAMPPPGPIPIASAKRDLEAVLAQGAGGAWLGYVEGALYAAGGS